MPRIYPYEIKISVIKCYYLNYKIKSLIYIYDVSKSTIYNWINEYNNNLLKINMNNRTTYDSKINKTICQYIENYTLKRKCTFNIKNLRKNIKRIYKINISRSRIYQILKNKNITHKKIYHKIIFKNKKYMNKSVNILLKTIKTFDPDKIISIDEVSFDTHIRKIKGWNLKGMRIIRETNNKPERKRLTVIVGISRKQVVGYKIINGSANRNTFAEFLDIIFSRIQNGILLMDNARIHQAIIIKNKINNSTNRVIYNVPYHPETNPIENIFSIIKNNVRNKNPNTLIELKKFIQKSFLKITKNKLKNIYKHSLNI